MTAGGREGGVSTRPTNDQDDIFDVLPEWIPLRVAYSHVLTAVEERLGVVRGSGHSELVAVPTDDHYGPTEEELIRLIGRHKKMKVDPPPASGASLPPLALGEEAIVEAHRILLQMLQGGVVTAQGIERWGNSEHPGSFSGESYRVIDRSEWRECIIADDDRGRRRWSGPIPDYSYSAVRLYFDFERGESLCIADIEVKYSDIVAHFPVFQAESNIVSLTGREQEQKNDLPPSGAQNVFRWSNGKWEVAFNNVNARMDVKIGLGMLAVLLAHPHREIPTSALVQAGEEVHKGMSPGEALRRALSSPGEILTRSSAHLHNDIFAGMQIGHEELLSLDVADVQRLKTELKKLKDLSERHATGRAKELAEGNAEAIASYTKKNTFRGRPKNANNQDEKISNRVSSALKRALIGLGVDCPPLADHLRPNGDGPIIASSGRRCYRPQGAFFWQTEPVSTLLENS